MPFKQILKTAPASLVLLTALACSGGGGGGPTGMPSANVAGTYTITHSLSAEGIGVLICPGVLVLSQNGTTFSGTVSVTSGQDCEPFVSQGPISGTVTSTGAVTFNVTLPILVGLLGQCEILSGGEDFTGSVTTTTITGTRTNQVNCPTFPFEGEISYTISGQKT